jgi:hypothetical protein
MMYDLALPATVPLVVPIIGIAALAAVYLVSEDADRRRRAWLLLKLLLQFLLRR